jgi:hypothetical protein
MTQRRNHAAVTASFQGKRERTRRLKQIRAGQVQGPAVSEEARYAAHGLYAPAGASLIVTLPPPPPGLRFIDGRR